MMSLPHSLSDDRGHPGRRGIGQTLWRRLMDRMLARYLLASMVALAVDFVIFLGLVPLGIAPGVAAGIGYCAGILVHWSISIRFVFNAKRRHRAALNSQRAGFIATALIGLAVTMMIVSLATYWQAVPIAAKAIATIISFFTVYIIRKYRVFR